LEKRTYIIAPTGKPLPVRRPIGSKRGRHGSTIAESYILQQSHKNVKLGIHNRNPPDNNQLVGKCTSLTKARSSPAGLLLSQMSPASSNCSESHDILDLEDDEGWEDLEPDVEKIKIVSLFGEDKFPNVQTMLQHCKDNHQFDLIKIRKELSMYIFLYLVGVHCIEG